MKITFVTPPYHSGIPELAGRWLPLGFVYLAGSARKAGVTAEIYDAMAKGDGYPEIEARLKHSHPDYVATSAMTATVNDAVKTLQLAKRLDPKTVTILGGIHPSFMYQEILSSCGEIDYIVIGEGEVTLRELLETLERGAPPRSPGSPSERTARWLRPESGRWCRISTRSRPHGTSWSGSSTSTS